LHFFRYFEWVVAIFIKQRTRRCVTAHIPQTNKDTSKVYVQIGTGMTNSTTTVEMSATVTLLTIGGKVFVSG
jgi:hypothetical protein